MNADSGENEPAWRPYRVVEAERVEADREAAYLFFLSRNPEYAARWLEGLDKVIKGLTEFPGPFMHAIDEEASEHYGRLVRRLLYKGPGKRRSGTTSHRVLFSVLFLADEPEDEIRILRILHGAQSPFEPNIEPEENE